MKKSLLFCAVASAFYSAENGGALGSGGIPRESLATPSGSAGGVSATPSADGEGKPGKAVAATAPIQERDADSARLRFAQHAAEAERNKEAQRAKNLGVEPNATRTAEQILADEDAAAAEAKAPPVPAPGDDVKPLEEFTVSELKEIAEKEGVEIPNDARKADIVAAIELKREEGK